MCAAEIKHMARVHCNVNQRLSDVHCAAIKICGTEELAAPGCDYREKNYFIFCNGLCWQLEIYLEYPHLDPVVQMSSYGTIICIGLFLYTPGGIVDI